MNILWIGGWAIPTQHMRNQVETAFPQFHHTLLHPSKDAIVTLKNSIHDAVIGYSLGATLLLQEQSNINQYCLAPFLNIKDATSVSETQLKFLLRKLKSDPINTIKDFYLRAQLDIDEIKELPYSLEDLCWGIETLLNTRHFLITNHNHFILLGQNDPLIKPHFFQLNFNKLKILKNTNHDLKPYLNHLISVSGSEKDEK